MKNKKKKKKKKKKKATTRMNHTRPRKADITRSFAFRPCLPRAQALLLDCIVRGVLVQGAQP